MQGTFRATRSRPILAKLLAFVAAGLVCTTASAQIDLITVEFNEDDQPGFDLWPGGIGGSLMTAQFGAITVDVSTNTSFASPTNRGSTNGNPPGYTYQNLYEDLLHAFTSTGTLTIDFSGLMPNHPYLFTLYAWDPGSTGTHEWSITAGTSVPPVITVDWSVPLTGNDTFALVFEVTTTSAGTFQVDNTAGLGGSAINGFRLSEVSGPIGASYCGPAIPNSTGFPGTISAVGSTIVSSGDVTLIAEGLPPGQFGYFLVGEMQGFFTPPGSSGIICLSGNIGRYNQIVNIIQGPTGSIPIDLTAIPVNPPTAVQPGDTWNFQCWYRDLNPTLTSNFTDGVAVTFQ
ncbi:MAG: hypothetical protein GY711_09120 [bacterium]|nr:hypothetical protein [bacterium]